MAESFGNMRLEKALYKPCGLGNESKDNVSVEYKLFSRCFKLNNGRVLIASSWRTEVFFCFIRRDQFAELRSCIHNIILSLCPSLYRAISVSHYVRPYTGQYQSLTMPVHM